MCVCGVCSPLEKHQKNKRVAPQLIKKLSAEGVEFYFGAHLIFFDGARAVIHAGQ